MSATTSNHLFPVFLKLEQMHLLLIGGGAVALEKLHSIIQNSPATKVKIVAKSVNSGLQVVIGNGNSIATTNALNTSTISVNKSALIWGDDAGSVSGWTSTGAPSSLRQIIGRTWKVQETGTIGSVKIQIADNSGVNGLPAEVNTVYLLIDSDGNFSNGATEIAMTLVGTNWEANVDLTNGQFFTFATQVQIAPGGVSGALVWLKSNTGTSTTTNGSGVSAWTNQMGSGNAIQTIAGNQPTYQIGSTDLINFNPIIRFNTANSQHFTLSANIFGNGTTRTAANIFALAKNTDVTQNNGFWYEHLDANNRVLQHLPWGSSGIYWDAGSVAVNERLQISSSLTNTTTPFLWSFLAQGTSQSIKQDGNVLGSNASANISYSYTNSQRYIGRSDAGYFGGDVGEIIGYGTSLTSLQIQQIESYLAIKYGKTLNQTSPTNYIASDGTTIFWNASANSAYKNNIAGIVRDDVSQLYQKQSRSINTGLQVVVGNENTISTTNTLNSTTISSDRSALVWGDDAGDVNAWLSNGAPAGLQIISRKWKLQETGTIGSVKVQIADNSGINGLPTEVFSVFLIVDADGNFSSGATPIPMTLNGTNWEVNVDFLNGQFFTFGTVLLTTTVSNVSCRNGSDGGIVLNIEGSGYTYDWSNNGPNHPDIDPKDLTGVPAGGYVVTITDSFGSTATTSATVSQPASALNMTNTVTPVNGAGGTNGAIQISVSGGTPGYSYLWSNGANTQNISNLSAGSYTVTVTDINGCSITGNMNVTVNSNAAIVNKQLYLSEGLSLDRINPAAAPIDNTTSVTSVLSSGSSGVVFDNSSNGATTHSSATSFVLSHTVGTNENRLLLVGVSLRSRTVVSASYAGVAMTLVGSRANGSNCNIYIYRLINPPSGTANVNVVLNGAPSTGVVIGATSFSGVNQSAPLGTFTSTTGNSGSPSRNVTSVSGDVVFDVLSVKNTNSLNPGSGQTERWDRSAGEIRGGSSTEVATGTSTTMSWNSGSGYWAIGGVAVKPATFVNNVTFTQNPVMCSPLTVKANNSITLSAYVNIISGNMPTNPNITAVIRYGGTTIISLSNPSYNSSTKILTWTGTRGSDITIPVNQAIALQITTNQSGVSFQIRHDSQTYPSKITLPVSTYINVNSIEFYNASYPFGTILSEVPSNVPSYIRINVTDPFGAPDITGLNLTLTKPDQSVVNIPLSEADVQDGVLCGKIYQLTWSNPGLEGTWEIQATAFEGSEGVTHAISTSVSVFTPSGPTVKLKQLYLSDPSQALDRIDPVNTGDGTTAQTATLTTSGALVTPAATTSGSASSVSIGGNLTFSHTPGSGSNRLMLVSVAVGNTGVSDEAAPGVVTGVTFGGTAMTLVSSVYSGNAVRSYIYRLINPSSAAANVVISIGTKASGVIASATTFINVHQTTPLGTGQTFVGNGTDSYMTANVTSADGELVYSTVAIDEYINVQQGITTFGGQTQLWNNSGFDWVSGASSTKAGASTVAVRYDFLDYEDACLAAVSIKPAASTGNFTTFTQNPVLCSPLTIKANQLITIKTHVSVVSGSMPANPAVTAQLKYGSTTIATINNPSFASNLLTWSVYLASDVTVPAGQAIALVITTEQSGVTFKLDYDSQTKPSRIEFPVTTYIDITSFGIYDAPNPGGTLITKTNYGTTVYMRAVVTDPFGTSDITGLNIFNAPLAINVQATSVATAGCARTYQYIWNTSPAPGTYSFTATAKEGYENTVTDVEYFTFSLCPITVSPSIASAPTCNATNSGFINLNVTGGHAPYNWNWSRTSPAGSGSGTGFSISDLSPGTYNITVTTDGGCSGTASITLNQPVGPALEAIITNTGSLCYDGGITLDITNGSDNYSYFWEDGIYTEDRENLSPGVYNVTVTDLDNGCTSIASAEILQGSPLLANANIINPGCSQGNNGIINLIPSGGAGSYTYLWSDGSQLKERSGLSEGSYHVTITDLGGCTGSFTYTLYSPSPLNLEIAKTDPSCFINGSINLNISGGTSPYLYNWNDMNGSFNPKDRTDLFPGSYSVTVTDFNNCSTTGNAVIAEPECDLDAITVCKSDTSDVFSVDPDPNVISYLWTVPEGAEIISGQGTSSITVNWEGASTGAEQVCVQSVNDCGPSSIICTPVYIKSVTPLISVAEPRCIGLDIMFSASGGSLYNWSGPNGFSSNLKDPIILNAIIGHSGQYYVTVTNENGCTASTSVSVTINSIPEASAIAENSTNCESNDGELLLSITGGVEPYSFEWSDGSFSQNLQNAGIGAYVVTVTDANGCTTNASGTIANQEGLSINVSKTDVSCFNANDGGANLTINGGSGEFEFQWSNGAITQNVVGLKHGSYKVTVTDTNDGCFGIATVNIIQPPKLQADKAIQHINEYGADNGAVSLFVSGGIPDYNFDWSDLSGSQNPKDRTDLSAGTYAVTITDSNDCPSTVSLNIFEPEGALSAIATPTHITCFGLSNGLIDLSVSGGYPPYNFLWSNGQTTEDIRGLALGTYTVTVTDAKLISTTATAIILQPGLLNTDIVVQHVYCFNEMTGALDLSVTGGTSPYSYRWSNGEGSEDIGHLSVGKYYLTVTDANNCITVDSIVIAQSDELVINSSIPSNELAVSCYGVFDGSINITPSGGAGPYRYYWSTGDSTSLLENLSPGNYTVTVTDNFGCSKQRVFNVSSRDLIAAQAVISPVYCAQESGGAINLIVSGGTAPYTYDWSNGETTKDLTDLTPGTYTVIITDANNCSLSSDVTISQPNNLEANIVQNFLDCYGVNQGSLEASISGGTVPYKYEWSNGANTQSISGLSDGIYFLTVTDYAGCTATSLTLISQPTKIVVSGVTVPNCPGQDNGMIMVFTTGGAEPYQYIWSNGGLDEMGRDGLGAGSYTITVVDNNGCSSSNTFTLTPVSLQFFNVIPSCGRDAESGNTYIKENGQIYAKVTGGMPPYTYNWSTGSTESYIDNLALGMYSVTVEANGCVITDQSLLFGNVCIPPVAEDDFYLTEMNVPVSGNLAINDYDPNTEYPLTFLPLGHIDEEVGIISWDSTFNGEFKYTPHQGYYGTFSLPYQICDTLNLCDIGNLTVRVEKPVLGAAKTVSNGPINNYDGSYDLTYTILVQNYSLLPLSGLQVVENLDLTFEGAVSYAVNNVSSTQFSVNNGFNGSGNNNLLSGNNNLEPFGTGTILLNITLVPGEKRGPYLNSALAKANSPMGVLFTDLSQNGTNPDPDNDGDPTNNNVPTPLLFCPAAEITGTSVVCLGSTTTLIPASNGFWTSSDTLIATINNNGVVTAISEGTVTFVYSQEGCSSEPSDTLTVVGKKAIVTGSTSICPGSTTTLSPASGGVWSSTNPSVAIVNNSGLVTGISTGTARFTYTESTSGCTSPQSEIVNVSTTPVVAVYGPSSICIGNTTQLSPASGGVWVSSNPSVATVDNLGLVTGVSQGIATFTFTQSSGCISNPTTAVTVNSKPIVFLTGDPEICIGTTTSFLPNVGGTWMSSDTIIAVINNSGIVTGRSAGSATFTFIQTSGGCVSMPSGNIIVRPKPVASVLGPQVICAGTTTTLSPNSEGVWTSSNSSVATVSNAGVVFGVSQGEVSFNFRSNETQCLSDPSSAITVNSRPNISFSGPTSICVGANSNMLPSTDGIWVSSNNNVAQITNSGLITAVSAGTANFTFISLSTGCVSNLSGNLTVVGRPTVSVTGNSSACIGTTTTLSPASGGTWTSSNSTIASVSNSGVVTGISAGTATFYFTETSTGCISMATAPVTINNVPSVSMTGPSTICAGFTTNVTPVSGGTWSSNNSLVASIANNGIVTGLSNGIATLTFTSSLGCASSPLQVIINGKPPITLNGPSSICLGTTTNLLPSSGGIWTSNNPAIASITNAGLVTGLAAGTVTFSYQDNLTECISDASMLITVNQKPAANITGASSICQGSVTTLTPTVGGSWSSTNPSVASVSNSGIVQGISAGTSTFIFTQTSTGCSSNASLPVTVHSKPIAEITGLTSICIGSNTQLSPTSGGTWTSTNPSIASITSSGLVTGHIQGSVRFIFTNSATGCVSNPSSWLTVENRPVATLNGDDQICVGTTTNVFPTTGGTWISTNPTVASITNTGVITGLSQGTSSFIYTSSSTGCVSESTALVAVNQALGINIQGAGIVCAGFTTTLSPSTGGVWISNNPQIATVSAAGIVTGVSAGKVTFTFNTTNNLCAASADSDTIRVTNCFEPDFNITTVNVPVSGNLNTNDMVPSGTTYGTNPFLISKPEASSEDILVNSDGTYTFTGSAAGVYVYQVPVCVLSTGSACPSSALTITVIDILSPGKQPIANPDYAQTYSNVNMSLPGDPVTLATLKNDQCIYGSGCLLDPLSVEIVSNPSYGIATIAANGNITYTPNPGFTGTDILTYKVCVMDELSNCAFAQQFIQVIDGLYNSNNTIFPNDDFFMTYQETPVSGNVLLNDLDLEGDNLTSTVSGSSFVPVNINGGNYFIDQNGNFTFTPDAGFSGSTSFIYNVCDDNTDVACAQATVHILVLRDLPVNIRVYLEGALLNNGNQKAPDNRPLMRDNLRMSPFTGQNYIPIQDPYSYATTFVDVRSKYKHYGAGLLSKNRIISDPATVFGVSGQNAIVDWVFVELRSKSDNRDVIATRSGLLQRDGDIVDLDGVSPLAFSGVAADSFYVVVRHRNHLGVMSDKVLVRNTVDLTIPQTQLYTIGTSLNNGYDYTGLSMNNQVKSGYRALWAGDFDGDGRLKFINPNDDQNILFFDVLVYPNNSLNSANYNFGHGYLQGDFDLNSKVKYDNPDDDKNLLFAQILLFPLNSGLLSNFNFISQQVPVALPK
ncbi:MAG: Ig-like domain-containing protein [Saprospiraceae bacterium]|nr:Ig-like domain-containing protein [Saprospiraceae bacterium]